LVPQVHAPFREGDASDEAALFQRVQYLRLLLSRPEEGHQPPEDTNSLYGEEKGRGEACKRFLGRSEGSGVFPVAKAEVQISRAREPGEIVLEDIEADEGVFGFEITEPLFLITINQLFQSAP